MSLLHHLRRNSETSDENTLEDHDCPWEDEEEEEEVTVHYEKKLEWEYTEHDGVAVFNDGTEREFTFDKFKRKENSIVLSNYEGSEVVGLSRTVEPEKIQDFVTIECSNLNYFETTDRKTRTLTETVEKTATETREDAEEWIENHQDDDKYVAMWIEEDVDDSPSAEGESIPRSVRNSDE